MAFLNRQLFLLLLAGALAVGFCFSQQLSWLVEFHWLKWAIVFVTLFAMSWPLKFGSLTATMLRPWVPLLAVAINFLLVPLIAWPMSGWLGHELGIGLLVAVSVPTTLATGAVWTRRAGGDDHVAMLVTLITNSLCFLVTPALLFSMTGNRVPTELFGDTVGKLLTFVVLPIGIAQLIRLETRSANWATLRKPFLGKIAQSGVLLMAMLGAVQTGLRVSDSESTLISPNQILLMIVVVVVVHVSALVFGLRAARLLKFSPGEQIAVAFSGSQKTLMVGLSIAINLGVSILPIVAYHALQLLIDTVVADRHRVRHPPAEEQREKD